MKLAILATGDEIVQGDTLNTNGFHIAEALHTHGFPPDLHVSCSDSKEQMVDCLRFIKSTHSVILITGGLGPTSDDRTRFALSEFIKEPLISFEEAMIHLQNRLQGTNMELNAGNKQQALFPQDATLFPNPYGSALGGYCRKDNTLYVLLPGPPRECLPMFNNYVLPLLNTEYQSDEKLLKWLVFGLPESELGEMMDGALAHLECQTGYRLDSPYVEFKVRCKPALEETVKSIINPLLKPYILTKNSQKASHYLSELITQTRKNISIKDEVTGGILETLLLRPDNYAFLKFNKANPADVNIEIQGLETYWIHKESKGNAIISFSLKTAEEVKQETHTFFYRSPLVLHYAAEWVSYKIAMYLEEFF